MKEITLRNLKVKDRKKIIKLVKAINSNDEFNLSEFMNNVSKKFDLDLTDEEIKIYTSNIPEESKKEFNKLTAEMKLEVLKQMKQEKEYVGNLIETIIELINVYDGIAEIVDEIIASLSGLELDEIQELDFELYVQIIKEFISSKQFKKLFPTA